MLPPLLGQNTAHASTVPVEIALSPQACVDPCSSLRAFDNARWASQVLGILCPASFWLHILEQCSGLRWGCHFSAILRSRIALSSPHCESFAHLCVVLGVALAYCTDDGLSALVHVNVFDSHLLAGFASKAIK